MKKLFLLAFLLALLTGLWQKAYAQQLSNMGKDFWIGYGHHVRMANNTAAPEKMQLYITSDVATSGKVAIPGIGHEQSFSVTPQKITTIDIPRSAALTGNGVFDRGIHVTAGQPVVVYSFIYVSAVSGATLCLPTNTLGRDYYSVNFDQKSNETNSHSYFFVVAADTGTTSVEITPSAATMGGQTPNVPFVVQLQQGQIYQLLGAVNGYTGSDLTGSRIRSVNTGTGCKKIAVFSGSSKISIGCTSAGTSDNLYQQVYPTATWSRKYIAVPSLVNSGNFFRIIRPDPSTVVRVNNQVIPASSFVRNFYYQFSGNQPCVIEADKAIMVAQYFPTEGCSGNTRPGDPEMIFLNPVDQNLKEVTLNSMQPSGVNIRQHFLNVILPNTPQALSSFKIDGQPYKNFTTLAADNGYAYAQISTTRGTHYLSCDSGFNVVSYGFGSAESYGYSGGTRLRDLYQFASVQNQFATLDYAATCAGSPFRLSMTFPFQPQEIRWQFDGLLPDVQVKAPLPDSVYSTNGKTVYRYTIPGWLTIDRPGTFPVKLLVANALGDGCTTEMEWEHELIVHPKATAGFGMLTKGCTGDTVQLTETYTNTNRLAAKSWLWHFGDGSKGSTPNPLATYPQPGTYQIQMAVINELGCITDTAVQDLTIHPRPQIGFTTTGPYCIGREVAFLNTTSLESGTIAKYYWQLGDGEQITTASGLPQLHAFSAEGNYTVQLEAISDKGCTNTPAQKSLTVTTMPKAGFRVPATCLADPYAAFTNTTTLLGTYRTLNYKWNFGDNRATDTATHPQHRYLSTGTFPVTLVATTAGGCSDTLVEAITINGANPRAAFSLVQGLTQCSDSAIVLRNESSIDAGKLVKMELYWDQVNDRQNRVQEETPLTGALYRFQPPSFFTPQSKRYTIRMVVHSGQSCQAMSEQTVTVHALPQLQFDTLPRFCSADQPYLIREAKLMNQVSGTGFFSGTGVTPAGVFTPIRAKEGGNRLRYTFKSTQGCMATAEQTANVFRSPLVDAGPDLVIRHGKQEPIRARSTGRALSYFWTPATGLSDNRVLQPMASPLQDQVYQIKVSTPEGCSATDQLLVQAPHQLYIPNSFTPNGDGLNDHWRIPYLMASDQATVSVYNRDGYCVYENRGATVSWDGRNKGVALNAGTFVYIVVLKATGQVYKGSLILIR